MQLALARGHRWLAWLTSGEMKSLREIARKEGVDSSYVSRMVNLTTLAPDIVAAILDETLPLDLTLFELAVDPPALWEERSTASSLVCWRGNGYSRFRSRCACCSPPIQICSRRSCKSSTGSSSDF